MNQLLLIIGIIALGNGNISLFDNDNKQKKSSNRQTNQNKEAKTRRRKKTKEEGRSPSFDMDDIKAGLKLMELSDEDLERGMEIIVRTKKYMSPEERKTLVKLESVLDLVRGIKKLSSVEEEDYEESNFFRSMDEDDKKNMMIKEILEVFPEKRKESLEKAIDIKKKIDLFAELFLPDDFLEDGFSLSSLMNINNLGSMGNLSVLGSLLRNDDNEEEEVCPKIDDHKHSKTEEEIEISRDT